MDRKHKARGLLDGRVQDFPVEHTGLMPFLQLGVSEEYSGQFRKL
jgi:hypothetical protein